MKFLPFSYGRPQPVELISRTILQTLALVCLLRASPVTDACHRGHHVWWHFFASFDTFKSYRETMTQVRDYTVIVVQDDFHTCRLSAHSLPTHEIMMYCQTIAGLCPLSKEPYI